MNILLSDGNLRIAVEDTVLNWLSSNEIVLSVENKHSLLYGVVPSIVDLIQSQKQAHADMVIGEDDIYEPTHDSPLTRYRQGRMAAFNQLRREQRERNKL